MEIREVTVARKTISDDGNSIFFNDADKYLYLAPNAKPFDTVEVKDAVKFHGDWTTSQKGKKYFKVIGLGDGELKPPQSDQNVLDEHQKVIDEAGAKISAPIAPQAIGMMTKEIGDMIRTKYLKPLFGDETYIELIKWYRGQVLAITRVPFNGANLPTFGKPKTAEPDLPEDDIPF